MSAEDAADKEPDAKGAGEGDGSLEPNRGELRSAQEAMDAIKSGDVEALARAMCSHHDSHKNDEHGDPQPGSSGGKTGKGLLFLLGRGKK